MPTVRANGLNIEYAETGDPRAPTILLIMGLGMQLIGWPDSFCQGLAERGFRVVRFDNRDVGRSSKMGGGNVIFLAAAVIRALRGGRVAARYTLHDMADDAIGVMDALGIERAHVVGASMGGMIGQVIAAEHAERVRSLVSIMSSSGNRRAGKPKSEVMRVMLSRPPARELDAAIEHFVALFGVIGSPGFPTERGARREVAERK